MNDELYLPIDIDGQLQDVIDDVQSLRLHGERLSGRCVAVPMTTLNRWELYLRSAITTYREES